MPTQNAILVDDSEDEEVRNVASSHRQSYEYVLSRTLTISSHTDLAPLQSEPMFCMFCNVDLNKYAPEDRQKHYDEHLSSMDTLRAHKLSSFHPCQLILPNVNSTPHRRLPSTKPTIIREKVTDKRQLFKSC